MDVFSMFLLSAQVSLKWSTTFFFFFLTAPPPSLVNTISI